MAGAQPEDEGASRTAWVFPGQGAQEVGMGRDLFAGSPAARRLLEAADSILGYKLTGLCFEGPAERLQETQFAQPAIFVMSLACLEAARESGSLPSTLPACVAGHSLGEYTALVAGGAISFERGLPLVAERGRLMQQAAEQRPGAMAAVLGLDEETVREICGQAGAEVCNLNAPGQVVVGGSAESIDAAMALALERGAQRGVRLNVSGAFHTSFMTPAADGMAKAVESAAIATPNVPLIANTTGEPLSDAAALRKELVRQLTSPVLWQRSVERLRLDGIREVIEFGPGRVLAGLIKRIDRSLGVRNVLDLATARTGAPAPTAP